MGEGVMEATIISWLYNEGDTVNEDDSVVEIATDKVDSDVPTPVSGKIVKILKHKDEVAKIGEAIAILDISTPLNGTAGEGEAAPVAETPKAEEPKTEAPAAEVVKELEKRGVDPSQIKSKGMGEAEAKVAETASDEERLQDRKVQVKYVLDSEWDSIPKNDIPTKLIIKK